MKKAKKSSRVAMSLIVIIVMLMCILFFVKTENLSNDYKAKEAQLAQINSEIAASKQKTEEIRNEIKYRETDDFIEDTAREALGLRYPDEIILMPENTGTGK